MASLFRRGKIYWAQVYDHGKRKRISLGTENFNVARAKVRRMEHDIETRGLQLETRTPVAEIIPRFLDYLAARGGQLRKGPQTDIYRLAEFFGPVCPELVTNSRAKVGNGQAKAKKADKPKKAYECAVNVKFLEEVTSGMVLNYLVKIQQSRILSTKTLNEYREILQRLFNWAIKSQGVRMPGDARHNPVVDVERFKAEQSPIRFLTIEQIHEQLDALADHPLDQTIVAVYIYAGLRREEALWLTHEDVDLDLGLIQVRAKTVEGRTWLPKTRVNRTVPISAALMEYLKRYKPNKSVPWYFASPQDSCWWDTDNLSRRLRRLNKKAGLPWGCLDFRHTFGSHLAMKGESLYKISKIMGNSPEICRRHYAALTPESLVGSVEFDTTPPPAPKPAEDSATIQPQP